MVVGTCYHDGGSRSVLSDAQWKVQSLEFCMSVVTGSSDTSMHVITHMAMQASGGIQQTASGGQHRGAWSEHLILKRASSLMQSKVPCLLQGSMILTSSRGYHEHVIIAFTSLLLVIQLARDGLRCSDVLHPTMSKSYA